MRRDPYLDTRDDVPAPLLKWSAVFGGLILGMALLVLLTSLWLALGRGSEIANIDQNLDWFIGISAVVSLFIGALIAGYLSGVKGAGTGMMHGFTLWGLLLLVTIGIGIPSILSTVGLNQTVQTVDTSTTLDTLRGDSALWTTFWTILGGFVAAGLGGMIGGAMTRAERRGPAVVRSEPRTDVVRVADEPMTRTETVERVPSDRSL
jgi:hypothetical protein